MMFLFYNLFSIIISESSRNFTTKKEVNLFLMTNYRIGRFESSGFKVPTKIEVKWQVHELAFIEPPFSPFKEMW
jgi:hypothetical protein